MHDLLLSGGVQAGDGPVKQALLRHKTRLRGEFQRVKIRRGAKSDSELALGDDVRAGTHYFFASAFPSWMRANSDTPCPQLGSLVMCGLTP